MSVVLGKGSPRTQTTTSSSPKTFSSHCPGHYGEGAGAVPYFRPGNILPYSSLRPAALSYRTAFLASVCLQVLQGDASSDSTALSRVFLRSLQCRKRRTIKNRGSRQHSFPVPCGREHDSEYGSGSAYSRSTRGHFSPRALSAAEYPVSAVEGCTAFRAWRTYVLKKGRP